MSPCRPPSRRTNRAGQVTRARSSAPSAAAPDVDAKLPTVLDILVAAQACLLEGQRDKAVSILETQWNFQGKCTPQPRGQEKQRGRGGGRGQYICGRALFPGWGKVSAELRERSRGVSKEKPPNPLTLRSAQTLTWLGIYYRYHWIQLQGGGNFWRGGNRDFSGVVFKFHPP